jgi:hypothetical protein
VFDVSLERKSEQKSYSDPNEDLAQAWIQKTSITSGGFQTELLTMRAAQYYQDGRGTNIVTLYCLDEPVADMTTNPHEIRWL